MELHAAISLLLELEDCSDAELGDAFAAKRVIVAVCDDHIAAVAVAAFQEPPSCGPRTRRRNDLEELAPDWDDGILEAEATDARVAKSDFESEDGIQVVDHARQRARHQSHLS
jgi:hypothetical protein